ncbi:MAG: preprotein translocase subunit SecA [Lautropia sp.]|nr:preprotein translocase subunit SecA [Lautropia sp.]
MFQTFLTSIFGSRNSRLLKQYRRRVARINALEPEIEKLSDEELRDKTRQFRERVDTEVEAGKPIQQALDDLLPEAFAVCREGSKRALGMRHFDVQMLGAMVLHAGKISEMRTGEGKTLTATLAVYLNALAGRGVHVVTVNDYLAQRDAAWMGRLYRFLGLTVGVVVAQQPQEEKRAAYRADITYGTNNEYGFDYLRDNMVYDAQSRMQRKLFYGIVDEVDSILIDEARTPLIISGPAEEHAELYVRMNAVPALLTPMEEEPKPNEGINPPGDYWVDHKSHQVYLSEAGHESAERILAEQGLLPEGASLYDPSHITLVHHLMVALRAHTLFLRDQHYVVQNDEVVIVDEFTGRLMAGRRWSDGLHQAVEAKEGVKIQAENQTLASITFQNYFRMYEKLAGMTGTADTEAYEFQEIYGLETVVVPTHRPMIRNDMQDLVYRTAKEKYDAILADIRDCYDRGQPVLVGTTSIENSELVSGLLKKAGLPHNVLNAKQHAREAEIVAQAGRPKQITIATNMAGRGTDIVLGGSNAQQKAEINDREDLDAEAKAAEIARLDTEWQPIHEQVLGFGGLHIIGTERHESRRIDNQLRGRAGRQGDPGSSRFYLSMEDPLLKIFAGDRLKAIMDRLRLPEGEAIESGLVSRSIESAQRKVEARNFDIRKQLLDYDDVANEQRKVIYAQRNGLLDAEEMTEVVTGLRQGTMEEVFRRFVPAGSIEEQWDIPGLEQALLADWQLSVPVAAWLAENSDLSDEDILNRITEAADAHYRAKVDRVGVAAFGNFERSVMLQSIDQHWREHLSALDHLRQGIHLRGYAQKNPKQEYKREAFELFERLLETIRTEVTRVLMNVHIQSAEEADEASDQVEDRAEQRAEGASLLHADADGAGVSSEDPESIALRSQQVQPRQRVQAAGRQSAYHRVGRNEPCPCGSGKKYKHCHGKLS